LRRISIYAIVIVILVYQTGGAILKTNYNVIEEHINSYSDTICFRITALARKISKLHNRACTNYKITAGQSFILFDLLENEGSSMTEISNRVQVETPAVTGYIDRLIKEDLVVRVDDPSDRRLFRIFLTDKGKNIAKLLLPDIRVVHNNITNLLDPGDFEVFQKCMSILEDSL